MTDFLKKDSLEFYTKVKEYLDILGVPYIEDSTLVRWLDYYSHTVWEFVDGSWRTQDAFGGGGRYDGLAKQSAGRMRFLRLGLLSVQKDLLKQW